jgi:hypothetical protein
VFALLVIVVLVLPYLIWLLRAEPIGVSQWPAAALKWPAAAQLTGLLLRWGELLGGLVLAMAGIVLLVILNSRFVSGLDNRKPEDAPVIFRPPVDPLARQFVYFLALAPALAGSLVAVLFGTDHVAGGAAVVLTMSGLAIVVFSGDLIHLRRQRVLRMAWLAAVVAPALAVVATIVVQPWFASTEVVTSMPASAMSRFFGENFQRRTSRPLQAVAGDPQLAALVGLGPSRPHLLLDATPERTPWMTSAKFSELGGVVVWRASDTAGKPPEDIAKRFPGLVPEIPRTFDRLVMGRQPALRVGWAIVRPKAP